MLLVENNCCYFCCCGHQRMKYEIMRQIFTWTIFKWVGEVVRPQHIFAVVYRSAKNFEIWTTKSCKYFRWQMCGKIIQNELNLWANWARLSMAAAHHPLTRIKSGKRKELVLDSFDRCPYPLCPVTYLLQVFPIVSHCTKLLIVSLTPHFVFFSSFAINKLLCFHQNKTLLMRDTVQQQQ